MSGWLSKLGFGSKSSSTSSPLGLRSVFSQRKLDSATLEDLEELLICSDMGVKATEQIIKDFSSRKIAKQATDTQIRTLLADSIKKILQPCEQAFNLGTSQPQVILMVGVNGAGKTTSIGKLASQLKHQGKQVSFIAADTFRAAAIEQLSVWGERNHIRIFKGEHGCDAAGLCFDGLKIAIDKQDDVVFIDTAGRLQNKTNLVEELQKIVRVIKKIIPDAPHHTLLCLDATTGQNALDQVKTFKQMTNVNGLIINKLDGTAKGGILAAVAVESPTPVYFIGVGEQIEDLRPFNAHDYTFSLLELN